MAAQIVVERVIDLPRAIVWGALVDPVLAEGWLHPSARLVGPGCDQLERVEPVTLAVRSVDFGEVRFELGELDGGSRGASTRLTVRLATVADARFRAPLIAGWRTRLDQLEDLLRGHPVDWANWERDRGADYEDYLLQASHAV